MESGQSRWKRGLTFLFSSWRTRLKRFAPFALAAVCVSVHASPFAPPELSTSPEVSAPSQDYRAVGAVILGERAIAVVREPDGGFLTVRLGESLGGATVVRITLDELRLQSASGALRLPVE